MYYEKKYKNNAIENKEKAINIFTIKTICDSFFYHV